MELEKKKNDESFRKLKLELSELKQSAENQSRFIIEN